MTAVAIGAMRYGPSLDPAKINPELLRSGFNGSLAIQDRSQRARTGPYRVQAAPGARINLAKNPRFLATSPQTGWTLGGSATVTYTVDPDLGQCGELTANLNGNGIRTTAPAGSSPIRAKVVHTASFAVKLISGASDWEIYAVETDAAGTLLGSAVLVSPITVTSTATRYRANYTPTQTGVHRVDFGIRRSSSNASVIRLSSAIIEEGNIASPTYFDGSTSGAAWADPLTGVPSSPNASASISAVTELIEDTTTNYPLNPSAEHATPMHGVSGANLTTGTDITNDATAAYLGARSWKTVTKGLVADEGFTIITSSALAIAGGSPFTGSIYLRGSGTVKIQCAVNYTDATADLSAYASLALTDSWQRLTTNPVNSNPAKTIDSFFLRVRNAATSVITFWADAAQIEPKAVATSYTDGSLGFGYTWNGTANNSASTRAAVVPPGPASLTATGAGAVRYRPAQGARINLAKNPSFETNQSGWGVSAGAGETITRLTTGGKYGPACLQIDSAFPDAGVICAGMLSSANIVSAGPHTLSIDVKHVSGATDWCLVAIAENANSVVTGTQLVVNITPTATYQRFTIAYTPNGLGAHRIRLYVRRRPGSSGASTILIDGLMIEAGNVGDQPYFDGASGGVWVDPYTGLLGTPNASASTSQVVSFIEETTTNAIRNPRFESATTDWEANGAGVLLTRDTTYANIGTAAAKLVTPATQINEGLRSLTNIFPASNGQVWSFSCWLRGSGTVYLSVTGNDAGGIFISGTTQASAMITLTDQWVRYSMTWTASNASIAFAQCYVRTWTVTPQAATFWVANTQLELKPQATSYCDGALGTGYTWTGTAHASSSTRAVSSVSTASAGRVSTLKGSYAIWVKNSGWTKASGGRYLIGLGSYGVNDFVSVTMTGSIPTLWCRLGADTHTLVSSGVNVANDAWAFIYASWDGPSLSISVNGGALVTGTRVGTPTGVTTSSIYFGTDPVSNQHANSDLGPTYIFDQPLTTADVAALYAQGPTSYLGMQSLYRQPARVNLAKNPLTSNVTGWLVTNATVVADTTWKMFGAASAKVTVTTPAGSVLYVVTNPPTFRPMVSGFPYTISFYAYNPGAADRSVGVLFTAFDNAGGNKGNLSSKSYTTVPAGQVVRIFRTGVVPAGSEGAYVAIYTDNGGTLPFAANDVLYVNAVQVEQGLTATPYFDGSVGGVWLDPQNGILGTPHVSASTSQAAAWIEEATTNYFPNPNSENASITNGCAATAGATLTKETTLSYLGAACAKAVTAGLAGGEGIVYTSASALGFTGSARPYTGSVYLRGSGTIDVWTRVTYNDATLIDGAKTTVVLTDSWQRVIPVSVTADGAKTINQLQLNVRTPSTSVVTFYADCCQIEEKAHATSYADGSLGTGYSWSGVANSSTSVRATTNVKFDQENSRFKASSGTVVVWVRRDVEAPAGFPTLYQIGQSGLTKDVFQLFCASVDDRLYTQWNSGSLGNKLAAITGQNVPLSVWTFGYGDWDGTVQRVAPNLLPFSIATRDYPVGDVEAATDSNIGSTTGGGNSINGLIGGLMIFDRPLTQIERTLLYDLGPNVDFNLLRDIVG